MSYYEKISAAGFRGPRFDEVGVDGVRRIGFRQGPPGEGGFRVPEHLVWEINPDGSAKYVRRWIPFRSWNSQGAGQPVDGVVIPEAEAGTPAWTYTFSPDAFKIFKMAASLYPNGVTEAGVHRYKMAWPEWDFPFTASDSASMRQWIISLSPAEAFGLYYSLVLYDGPQVGLCTFRKFVPLVSPKEFESNSFWPVFQQMLMQAIYDVRTDLHKVTDPSTGKTIDGLIKYDLFEMPCKKSLGEKLVGYVGIAGQVAMAFVTLGASTAFQAVSTVVSASIDIVNTVDTAQKQRAILAFSNSVVKGYTSGTDINNILQPPPKLTPEEQKLVDKASGETKSPTEVVGEAKTATAGGGNPWLLIAGAVAAAALLS
jgi:hypothetical protein